MKKRQEVTQSKIKKMLTDNPQLDFIEADRLIPEEDNPQLDFIEETLTTNDRITVETKCNNPDGLFARAANRVEFSGSSYHELVRIQPPQGAHTKSNPSIV